MRFVAMLTVLAVGGMFATEQRASAWWGGYGHGWGGYGHGWGGGWGGYGYGWGGCGYGWGGCGPCFYCCLPGAPTNGNGTTPEPQGFVHIILIGDTQTDDASLRAGIGENVRLMNLLLSNGIPANRRAGPTTIDGANAFPKNILDTIANLPNVNAADTVLVYYTGKGRYENNDLVMEMFAGGKPALPLTAADLNAAMARTGAGYRLVLADVVTANAGKVVAPSVPVTPPSNNPVLSALLFGHTGDTTVVGFSGPPNEPNGFGTATGGLFTLTFYDECGTQPSPTIPAPAAGGNYWQAFFPALQNAVRDQFTTFQGDAGASAALKQQKSQTPRDLFNLSVTRAIDQSAPMDRARIIVNVPRDARLYIDGRLARQESGRRVFDSPPLDVGKKYQYDLVVQVERDGALVSEARNVTLESGKVSRVDFTETTLAAASRGFLPPPAQLLASKLIVEMPADARLTLNGVATQQATSRRTFAVPAASPGRKCEYELEAEIVHDGQTVREKRWIAFHPGETVQVDFSTGAVATASKARKELLAAEKARATLAGR